MYKDSELEKILEETHNIYCEVSGHNYDVPKWEETLIKIMEILKTILNTPQSGLDKIKVIEILHEMRGRISETGVTKSEANYSYFADKIIHEDKLARLKEKQAQEITVEELAEFMHIRYEEIARKEVWNTQEECQVKFKDLPEANRKTMLGVAEAVQELYKSKLKEKQAKVPTVEELTYLMDKRFCELYPKSATAIIGMRWNLLPTIMNGIAKAVRELIKSKQKENK